MKWYNINISLALLIAQLLQACSGVDENTRDDVFVNDLISYTVATTPTRSAIINGPHFPADKSFRVWAFEDNSNETVINGDVASCINDSVWNTEEKYYWHETKQVSFYAIYPISLSLTDDTKRFAYTMPTDVSKQEDVLYDVVTVTKVDSNKTVKHDAVPLTFRHALAQVAFKGIVSADNPDWTVTVSGIAIHNIYGTGTFDLISKTWNNLSTPTYSEIGIHAEGVSFTYNDGAKALNLTADDGAILVIPQVLTGWDRTDTVHNTSGSYLAVTCHLCNDDGDLFGTATKPQTIYVPFDHGGIPWQQGRKYVYTLQFGAGFDADGNKYLQVMVVSSNITEWADGDGGNLNADKCSL